jgi:Tol biopolymer transport system component
MKTKFGKTCALLSYVFFLLSCSIFPAPIVERAATDLAPNAAEQVACDLYKQNPGFYGNQPPAGCEIVTPPLDITKTPVEPTVRSRGSPMIVFSSIINNEGVVNFNISLANPKRLEERVELTNSVDNELIPVWSPDFSKIAYTLSVGPSEITSIWIMNADGSNPYSITDTVAIPPGAGGGAIYVAQAWSPDGEKVYITKYSSTHDSIWCDLFWVEAQQDSVHRKHPVLGAEDQCHASISPDGKSIIVTSYDGFKIGDLSVDGTRVSNLKKLVPEDFYEFDMFASFTDWSPDGSQIVFSSNGKVYTVKASGGMPQRVLPNANSIEEVRWSPDGLFFVIADGGDITVVSVDGLIVSSLRGALTPDW